MADLITRPDTKNRLADGNEAKHGRRGAFLKWLRKTHGWVGLWAIALTVLFGVTGVLQNHRWTKKIERVEMSTVHVALPAVHPASPEALAEFLRAQMHIDHPAVGIRREPARPVPWGERSVMQPERWELRFLAPDHIVTAEYWKGDNAVEVKRQRRGPVGTLTGLHMALGTSLSWVLVSDSVAIGLIFLSITGFLLWLKLERRRMIGIVVFAASLLTVVAVTVQSL